jgi:hypothetical protein
MEVGLALNCQAVAVSNHVERKETGYGSPLSPSQRERAGVRGCSLMPGSADRSRPSVWGIDPIIDSLTRGRSTGHSLIKFKPDVDTAKKRHGYLPISLWNLI